MSIKDNMQRRLGLDAETLPQRVREGVAFVAAAADFVRIRHRQIDVYVTELLDRNPLITSLDTKTHFLSEASPAATAAYVLALDSINFGSGYFAIAESAGIELNYNTVSSCLKKTFTESRLNTPIKWLAATADECHEIFGVRREADPELDWLMASFADHLGAMGQFLTEHYAGEVMNLLEACGNSAVSLVERIGVEPSFNDVAYYKGVEIPLFKRAQILAADLHLAFGGKAPAAFGDIGELTSFADNMVPHVLRCDGILEYAPVLAERIDAGKTLEPGSPEEIEIRACALHAVELMTEAAHRHGREVSAVNLDHILWNRGQLTEIAAKPCHRTLTAWY